MNNAISIMIVIGAILIGIVLLTVAFHFLARFLSDRWPLVSAETCNNIWDKIKTMSILIHIVAWILGVVCFALASAGINMLFYGWGVAVFVAFYSSIIALPVALAELFRSKEKPMIIRLKFAGVAIMATIILACGIVFSILTAGRH